MNKALRSVFPTRLAKEEADLHTEIRLPMYLLLLYRVLPRAIQPNPFMLRG
jgi:hypothetical protein